LLGRLHFDDLELDVFVRLVERPDQPGDQAAPEGGFSDPDPDPAGETMGGQPGSFQAMVESVQDLGAPLGQDLAGQGELDAFGATNQEGGAGSTASRYAFRVGGYARV
jgi:hypothetical protein